MEPRARTRLNLRRAGLLAALTALLVPAVAGTATADAAKRKSKRLPVVTSVTPKSANVGDTLTIRGRNFRTGREKNTVVFKRRRGKAVFVKARIATRKLLKVELPKRLEAQMAVVNGAPVATRFKLRVLSQRLGRRWAKGKSRRPLIGPELPPPPPTPPVPPDEGDCDGDRILNGVDGDDDNDLLADATEIRLRLDTCKADSDGDGVSDGYEHASASDLNDDEHQDPNAFLPYPTKRPYPNALDDSDAGTDHDGDSLTLIEEYKLWRYAGGGLSPLAYSAGEQYSINSRSGRRTPTLAAAGYDKQAQFLAWTSAAGYNQVALADVGTTLGDPGADWWEPRRYFSILDFDRSDGAASPAAAGGPTAVERLYYDGDRNGYLDDGERDEDADGLSNFHETRSCMNRGLWDGLYGKETPYPLAYGGTLHDDPDSDGDGVLDGADDQDNDDVPNVMECSRQLAADLSRDAPGATAPRTGLPASGFVNPFNPCLPHHRSRTCRSYVTLDSPWAPFNADDEYYYIFN